MGFESLQTARLRLRRFAAADLPAFVAYRNHPDVARYQSWDGFTSEQAISFLEEQQALEPGSPGRWFQFAIELKQDGRLIGDCALHVNSADQRLGEIGFTLAPDFQGQGYATEAAGRVLQYAFEQLGLHRISAITDCRNTAANALLQRLGMRQEAHFRQHAWFKGAWCDEFLHAILKSEWRG